MAESALAENLITLKEELPDEIANAVSEMVRAVSDIETLVRRLQQAPWAEVCRGLSHLESARLHLMVAYTVNTLFYSAPSP